MTLWSWPSLRALALLRRLTIAAEDLARTSRAQLELSQRLHPPVRPPRLASVEVPTVADWNAAYRDQHPSLDGDD